MRVIIFIILSVLFIISCSKLKQELIVKEESLIKYESISNESNATVIISDSIPQDKIKFVGNSDLLKSIKYNVNNNKLVIESDDKYIKQNVDNKVYIYINNNKLKAINSTGIGVVNSNSIQTNETLKIQVSQLSKAKINIDNEKILLNITDSGNVTLIGKTNRANFNLVGTSKVDASFFHCNIASVNIKKAGYIKINVSDSLIASVTDLGKVLYKNKKTLNIKESIYKLGTISSYN